MNPTEIRPGEKILQNVKVCGILSLVSTISASMVRDLILPFDNLRDIVGKVNSVKHPTLKYLRIAAKSVSIRRNENCKDFVSAEVMYHPTCYASFRHDVSFNVAEGGKSKKLSSDLNMLSCFYRTCEWSEGDIEPHSMSEFEAKMIELANSDKVFSKKYLKTLLKQKYGEFIDFTQDKRVSNVIIFKDMAAYIIKKKYKEAKENITEETACIISVAANLIKAEICKRNYSNEIYPTSDNILKSVWVPSSLQLFLKLIINSQLRQEMISHGIVKVAKSRIESPPIKVFG